MAFIQQLALVSALLACSFGVVQGSIFTISDDRVRNMDITPVLGRGYSIMTNQFHSTCLMVDAVTVPTYNYDCKSSCKFCYFYWFHCNQIMTDRFTFVLKISSLILHNLLIENHHWRENYQFHLHMQVSKENSPNQGLLNQRLLPKPTWSQPQCALNVTTPV